jgi:cytochrome c-type biogenesis protein CcmE
VSAVAGGGRSGRGLSRKNRRLVFLLLGLLCLGAATALVLLAFGDSLAFFRTPSELAREPPPAGRALRLGGLVQEGTFVRDGEEARFAVTDLAASVPVRYVGALPDLFREGQGVVVEGRVEGDLAAGGWFAADTVLAKHDERYMPREAVEALKEAGQWRPEGSEP